MAVADKRACMRGPNSVHHPGKTAACCFGPRPDNAPTRARTRARTAWALYLYRPWCGINGWSRTKAPNTR
ncbi:uncharacterized protein SETTUDRAFT_166025 [Exserohilum turcica Et28A]|uniref:Uncharacterized protein n=1 Tax=Exserohilum turcicum (strain 28A) TaxID=671987 RepID=R0I8B6_EXST2|nr:uncharacterized protein SETTUDRAFT_166025 [Exserohilum turcica Et28A]EOA81631.1 hypothetical protein SETTUDRAFT_166025 [Exserohilum turcica Et28A]